jgi:hypothetical protein
VEYGELLWEYPPLVGELVSKYPLTTIKQLAAAVNKAAAGLMQSSGCGVGGVLVQTRETVMRCRA